jgi:serine/threonine protein kinase
MSVTPKTVIGNYELGELIGKGTFGKVCKATHIPTSFDVAIKILDRSLIVQEADFERVSR